MIEYAIMKHGGIVNVVTCDSAVADTSTLTSRMLDGPYDVKPLDQLPLAVCQRYEYWDTRP